MTPKKYDIKDAISDIYPDVLFMDGCDSAIIGICTRMCQEPIVAYDVNKVINILIDESGMSEEEAYEYFEYNQQGAWMGDNTPCFILTDN